MNEHLAAGAGDLVEVSVPVPTSAESAPAHHNAVPDGPDPTTTAEEPAA